MLREINLISLLQVGVQHKTSELQSKVSHLVRVNVSKNKVAFKNNLLP